MKKKHAEKCCRGNGHFPMRCCCDCTCDGYHTFDELYEHRITLFIALCRHIVERGMFLVWKSKLHNDGTSFDGWFILGINKKKGEQMTYHIPLSRWEDIDVAKILEKAPKFDGHTSDDVIERLKEL